MDGVGGSVRSIIILIIPRWPRTARAYREGRPPPPANIGQHKLGGPGTNIRLGGKWCKTVPAQDWALNVFISFMC